MRRFFLDQDITIGKKITLPEREAKHLRDSLRMRQGEQVIVFNGVSEYLAVLDKVTHDFVSVGIVGQMENNDAPGVTGPQITLYLSLIKLPNFELVVQKATELGAHRIVPVIAEYSQVRASEFGAQKRTRLEKIIIDACKQAERSDIPEMTEILDAENVITAPAADNALRLFCTLPRQTKLPVSLLTAATVELKAANQIEIFIGPEGGFAAGEHKLAQENGWELVSLGKEILRTETAAIVALGAVNLLLQSNN